MMSEFFGKYSPYLAYIPSIVLISSAVLSFFLARKTFRNFTVKDSDLTWNENDQTIDSGKGTFISKTAKRRKFEYKTAHTVESHILSRAEFETYIDQLADEVRKIEPEWLFGVHIGGRLLSTLVADRVGIERRRCVYIKTDGDYLSGISLIPNPNLIEGNLVVIDDIMRSGSTMDLIGRYFKEKLGRDNVKFLTMAQFDSSDRKNLDNTWSSFKVKDYYFQFPWTDFGKKLRGEYRKMKEGNDYSNEVMDKYNKLVTDYHYCLSQAKSYVNKLI